MVEIDLENISTRVYSSHFVYERCNSAMYRQTLIQYLSRPFTIETSLQFNTTVASLNILLRYAPNLHREDNQLFYDTIVTLKNNIKTHSKFYAKEALTLQQFQVWEERVNLYQKMLPMLIRCALKPFH